MTNLEAFQWYIAFKVHYTNPKFDIRTSRNAIRNCSYQNLIKRNDAKIFESFARKFELKYYLNYLIANFMYGNTNMLYDQTVGTCNYNLYIRRRDSLSEIITNDLHTIERCVRIIDGKYDRLQILRLLPKNLITFETVVVLNTILRITDEVRQTALRSILEPLLLRIDKSVTFIRPTPEIIELIKQTLN